MKSYSELCGEGWGGEGTLAVEKPFSQSDVAVENS